MNITLTIGSWIFPTIVTLLGVLATFIISYKERHESGIMSGLGTIIFASFTIVTSLVAWIMWALMVAFGK